MFKLKVQVRKNKWVEGIKTYETAIDAEKRIEQLNKVGIEARLMRYADSDECWAREVDKKIKH